jgi:co-chaperonin GroES (HSP10)
MDITPQVGYVVVKWTEEEKVEGEVKRESGIILSEDTANRLQKESTHKEWEDSSLRAGTKGITSKFTQAIPIELNDGKIGIMAETEIVACY